MQQYQFLRRHELLDIDARWRRWSTLQTSNSANTLNSFRVGLVATKIFLID